MLNLTGKLASEPPLNKPCSFQIRSWLMFNLPRAASDPSTEQTSTSLSPRGPNYGWTSNSTPWVPNSMSPKNFSEKNKPNARHKDGYNLQALDKGMTSVVLEQFGRTAPGAQAIFNRIIHHRLQLLVRQGPPFSYAKRVASSELSGPISNTMLRAAWQPHAECAPRIGSADLGDTPPSLPDSSGEMQ